MCEPGRTGNSLIPRQLLLLSAEEQEHDAAVGEQLVWWWGGGVVWWHTLDPIKPINGCLSAKAHLKTVLTMWTRLWQSRLMATLDMITLSFSIRSKVVDQPANMSPADLLIPALPRTACRHPVPYFHHESSPCSRDSWGDATGQEICSVSSVLLEGFEMIHCVNTPPVLQSPAPPFSSGVRRGGQTGRTTKWRRRRHIRDEPRKKGGNKGEKEGGILFQKGMDGGSRG
ncbi:unnamed protein product [Pleuronectes platessa]|uniref:Uncharacterized protein n=1 Tax=Pleuronectes platessa TaxID=8262 RepID=A0A9N7YGF3_PLEPL|nr:unnamed protein product [Pleuronectes platessa]